MRRAPRSSLLLAITPLIPGWSVSTWGTSRRHWARRSVGVARSTGSPHRYLGLMATPSMIGANSIQVDHSLRGGTLTSKVAMSALTLLVPLKRISTPRDTPARLMEWTTVLRPVSDPSPGASGTEVERVPDGGSDSARPSFTAVSYTH